MTPITYRLPDAARILDVPESYLAELRDNGKLLTYCLAGVEYITDHAMRDLQHRAEVGDAEFITAADDGA